MYAGALTKKNGDIVLTQMFMRIGRMIISEEKPTLQRHQYMPEKWYSKLKSPPVSLLEAKLQVVVVAVIGLNDKCAAACL